MEAGPQSAGAGAPDRCRSVVGTTGPGAVADSTAAGTGRCPGSGRGSGAGSSARAAVCRPPAEAPTRRLRSQVLVCPISPGCGGVHGRPDGARPAHTLRPPLRLHRWLRRGARRLHRAGSPERAAIRRIARTNATSGHHRIGPDRSPTVPARHGRPHRIRGSLRERGHLSPGTWRARPVWSAPRVRALDRPRRRPTGDLDLEGGHQDRSCRRGAYGACCQALRPRMCDGPGPDASGCVTAALSTCARGPVSKTAPASCGRGRVQSCRSPVAPPRGRRTSTTNPSPALTWADRTF
jgi:hypothetical protein